MLALGLALLQVRTLDIPISSWRAGNSAISAAKNGVTVSFKTVEWPSIQYKPDPAMDWSDSGYLAVDVTNPSSTTETFGIRVDDDASANGFNHSRQGMAAIEAGKTATYVLAVGLDPKKYGMNGVPGPKNVRLIGTSGAPGYNTAHIVAVQFFMHNPAKETSLSFANLRLLPAANLKGIVDRFGQYTGETWPGKLKSEEEFVSRRAYEIADYSRTPMLPERDEYGGWELGPKSNGTGFFRTAKVDGRWWLITPKGHYFFSLGCDCVSHQSSTFLTGREDMFTDLPKPIDGFDQFFGHERTDHGGQHKEGQTFHFYEANLYRKYGYTWKEDFRKNSLRRLASWGFNTIGNWSDFGLYRNGQVPYVGTLWINGSYKKVASGNDYWGQMHDPFDPAFRAAVRQGFAYQTTLCKKDPWCVGYFVDNELSWAGQGPEEGRYGLAIGALANGPDSPAKMAFVEQLRHKYPSIGQLNIAWETSFRDWEQFKEPAKGPWHFGDAQRKDMGAFVYLLSDTYHRVVSEELRKVDPDHLYLGCRFAWFGRDAVEAAVKYTDVLSFNIYTPRLDRAKWDWLNTLDRPVVIGEFHFGATDRGMFHPGLVDAQSQAGRGRMYEDYITSVAQNPCFVGCHWFQYIDEPLTGRTLDGENYQIGMVDVTDTPYPEITEAARRIHGQAYQIHAKSK